MGSRKMVSTTLVHGSERDTDRKNRLWTQWEKEGGMIWENNTETHTLPNVNQIASGKPKAGFCDNLEGWSGKGGGSSVPEGEDTCMPMAKSCWCIAKTIVIL